MIPRLTFTLAAVLALAGISGTLAVFLAGLAWVLLVMPVLYLKFRVEKTQEVGCPHELAGDVDVVAAD